MGTLFHTITPAHAPELRLMGRMGYDAITLGNHELDLHADNLARMVQAARASGERLPAIVASNFSIDGTTPRGRALQEVFDDLPVRDYVVVERNGLRVGLFGLMGRDAGEDTVRPRDVTFGDPVGAARRVTQTLRTTERVDVVVALSHSGTSSTPSRSADEILARQVPDIDVIISGHSHTVLPQPIVVGKTHIVSARSYAAYLGVLALDYAQPRGRPVDYAVHEVAFGLPEDPEIAAEIARYRDIVDREFLAPYRLRFDQVLAEMDLDLEPVAALYRNPGDRALGNLVTDAFRHAIRRAEGPAGAHVHVALQPIGLIRASLVRGHLTLDDVFRVLSLGLGPDRRIGQPLVAVYLTGDEVRRALEVEATLAPWIKDDAHLQVSGVRFTHNPHRMPFERVTSVVIQESTGEYRPAEPTRLYRVAVNYWVAELLDLISERSRQVVSGSRWEWDSQCPGTVPAARAGASPQCRRGSRSISSGAAVA
jgi:5'-nucleotidase/UDP-sugar diphosphatase